VTSASATPDRLLLTGRLVGPDRVVGAGAVVVEDDRIVYAGELTSLPARLSSARTPRGWAEGLTLLPGLVDVHCHGGAGGEFGPDADGAREAAAHHHRSGSTTVIGSLVSAPAETLAQGVRILVPLVREGQLAGIHLEGPFLSTVRCGAQDPAALVDVDLSLLAELAEAADGALAHMTFAPERDPGHALPAALAAVGSLGSVGHTDADYTTTAAALEAVARAGARGGSTLVTHLFNGMPPLHHRAPGPVAACLAAAARSQAVVELIADGVHLDGGTVRMVFDTVGAGQVALVSDAMAASGLTEGDYSLGGRAVRVQDGAARLVDGGSLAGGISTLLEQVRWCVQELDIELADAVAAASSTPARALALSDVGALTAGSHADVLVVDDSLHLHRVLRHGAWLPLPR
jgi:N-acetylglucosamine-6-phosphate deacetylase